MGMKVNGTTGLIFPDDTTMSTGSQAVRAWVNFNGTGTVAIRAAYNVTSITDIGTGDYAVNFTTAMPDANYSCVGCTNDQASGVGGRFNPILLTSTAARVYSLNPDAGTGFADNVGVYVAIFR